MKKEIKAAASNSSKAKQTSPTPADKKKEDSPRKEAPGKRKPREE